MARGYTNGKLKYQKEQKLLEISDGKLRVEIVTKLSSKGLKHEKCKSNNF